jgi:hypothetical protein
MKYHNFLIYICATIPQTGYVFTVYYIFYMFFESSIFVQLTGGFIKILLEQCTMSFMRYMVSFFSDKSLQSSLSSIFLSYSLCKSFHELDTVANAYFIWLIKKINKVQHQILKVYSKLYN